MGAGDVLLFHSHTVHAARPNISDGALRISADYRFQSASLPVVADSLQPHMGRLRWDDVYADWPEPGDLRFYWRRLPLDVAPRRADLFVAEPTHR
jgi:hypothetical protein